MKTMKNYNLFSFGIMLMALWWNAPSAQAQDTLVMEINVNSQAQVNGLKTTLAGKKVIQGDVTIGYTSGGQRTDITDLSPFSSITGITGSLEIRRNGQLSDLNALTSLQSIGGGFWVQNNDKLTQIGNFDELQSIGSYFNVGDNDRLTDMGNFDSLRSIGEFFIVFDNDSLTQIGSFGALDSIGSYFNVRDNGKLLSLGAFPELFSIGVGRAYAPSLGRIDNTSIVILGNPNLALCAGLKELLLSDGTNEVTGDIYISNNAAGCNSEEEIKTNTPPTDIMLSDTTIQENAPADTMIATLAVTDADTSDTHTYTLSGTDSASFRISNDTLYAINSFDFETKPSYAITITSDDRNGGTYSENFTIAVTDVNEVPTDIMLSDTTIAENQPADTMIALITATDPDTNNEHTYTLGGADADSFRISKDTLYAINSFDFETKPSYAITITADDRNGGTYSENFTINVTDVNETPTDITLSAIEIEENAPADTMIAIITATDDDANDMLTYTLGGADADSFRISKDTLYAKKMFNFEATKNSYEISIEVNDGNGGIYSENFTIAVTNINETPTDIALSATEIKENAPADTMIAIISATDDDANDTLTYTLSGADADSFRIAKDTLYAKKTFDFETKPSYEVAITADDGNGGTSKKEFTIAITDVNESPTAITLSNATVLSSAPIGTIVGRLNAADQDAGDSLTFTLKTLTDTFEVKGDTLQTKAELKEQTYMLSITVDDGKGGTYTDTLDVRATSFLINLSESDIQENQPVGSTIGVLSTSDNAGDASRTFTLGSESMTLFTIEGNTLKSNAMFDYESGNTTLSVVISTTDPDEKDHSQTFTIAVTDVNETPTDIMLSATEIEENAPADTMIALISATDPDTNDTLTYTLSGADADSFRISNDTLYARSSFDFEDKASYAITIEVNDGNGGTYSENFTIAVVNVSDQPPTDIQLSATTIAENQPADTKVATITTTDPDTSDMHTYTLSGADADSFRISKDTLYATKTFDFEVTKKSYDITITADDGNGGTYSENFTISVTDINETGENVAPTDIALSDTTIAENQPANSKVATITATDADPSDTHTYTLGGTDAASFRISNDTLYATSSFDFETKPSYTIAITANDGNGGTYSENFTIAVTDDENEPENNAPTDISLSDTTIAENQPANTKVATITATDADASDTHTYTLSGSDAASFRISNDTLYARSGFDFETKASYTITITANDGNGGTYSESFAIVVTDVEEGGGTMLSVDRLSESAQIFPTVAQDAFTLTISNQTKGAIQLSIYAVNGAIVKTERYHKIARTLSKKVDISRLSKGVYIVNVQMDGQAVVSRKIVKR